MAFSAENSDTTDGSNRDNAPAESVENNNTNDDDDEERDPSGSHQLRKMQGSHTPAYACNSSFLSFPPLLSTTITTLPTSTLDKTQ